MKSLSEPAVLAVSRRDLLQRYFQHYPVPRCDPDGTLTVQVDLSGFLYKESRAVVTYTHDEVMHVLGEMKLKGIPYETAEEAQRRRDEATRKEIELLRWDYKRRQILVEEMNEMAGMPADYGIVKDPGPEPTKRDDLVDSTGFFHRVTSKFFGTL